MKLVCVNLQESLWSQLGFGEWGMLPFSKWCTFHIRKGQKRGLKKVPCFLFVFIFFFLRLYLFIWQREHANTSRGSHRQREREKQAPHWAGNLMQGLIPGPWDHNLSWRQMPNQLSHPGAPNCVYLFDLWCWWWCWASSQHKVLGTECVGCTEERLLVPFRKWRTLSGDWVLPSWSETEMGVYKKLKTSVVQLFVQINSHSGNPEAMGLLHVSLCLSLKVISKQSLWVSPRISSHSRTTGMPTD